MSVNCNDLTWCCLQTLLDLNLDGCKALIWAIRQTEFRELPQAVASLTVFSHPTTIAQTSCEPVFPIVRNFQKRGFVERQKNVLIGFDDNNSPTEAFLWANGISRRPNNLQFNHVYARSDDPECYTNLANLCACPAFLAKLTDTNNEVMALLQYRAFDLFGWKPNCVPDPEKPDGYSDLIWCAPLPAVTDVEALLCEQVHRRNNRTIRMIAKTGWLFDGQSSQNT